MHVDRGKCRADPRNLRRCAFSILHCSFLPCVPCPGISIILYNVLASAPPHPPGDEHRRLNSAQDLPPSGRTALYRPRRDISCAHGCAKIQDAEGGAVLAQRPCFQEGRPSHRPGLALRHCVPLWVARSCDRRRKADSPDGL